MPWGLYNKILHILSKDQNKGIQEYIASDLEKREKLFKALMMTIAPDIKFFKFIETLYKPTQEFAEMSKEFNEKSQRFFDSFQVIKPNFEAAKQFQEYTDVINAFQTSVSGRVLSGVWGYYTPAELKILKEPQTLPKKTRGDELAAKLEACPEGRQNWRSYEDVCLEILTYCLVPPLQDPFVQTPTGDRAQRRDIIFPFPHERNDFWGFIANTLQSDGVIMDCKNYNSENYWYRLPDGTWQYSDWYYAITFNMVITES